ncbi:MAG TPA: hypothetical protein VGN23_17015 [Verrucomicrobiae bacterium]|jgi:hypothetical protein
MNEGAAKIRMINLSLRCFTFGMLALLPFIGVPFGLVALVYAGKARVAGKQRWNPAHRYLMVGGVVGALFVLLWVVVFGLILWNTLNPSPD